MKKHKNISIKSVQIIVYKPKLFNVIISFLEEWARENFFRHPQLRAGQGCAGADPHLPGDRRVRISSTLPARGATSEEIKVPMREQFQSTLPARGAT